VTDTTVDITFQADKPGSTRGLLMVMQGDTVLHSDRIDIAKAKDRTAFLNKLKKVCTSIDTEAIQQQMLEQVRCASETSTEASTQPPTELNVSRIVRPHLFHVREASGLLVPVAQITGRNVAGRWLLFVQWADGKRECLDVVDYLDVKDAERIWFSPKPAPPLPTTISRWSPEGRHRWLHGYQPDVKAIFQRLFDRFLDYLEFPPDDMMGTVSTLSLWTMLTYTYCAWSAVPYLSIGGPLGSGKSRTFEVLGLLVYNPMQSSNLTAPCLFRTLHMQGGTVLLDEAERLKDRTPDAGEMRSILLAGYKRGGQASRLEKSGEDFTPTSFDVYGPKALAAISNLPSALASRCIRIMMFRAGRDSPVPKRRIDPTAKIWRELRDDLHSMALTYGATFVKMTNWLPGCGDLNGRALELWQPILALAKFVEDAGMPGLVETVEAHAARSIASASDEVVPEEDEVLLQLLKQQLLDKPWGVTPSEVLEVAKNEEPALFSRYSPRGISAVLGRYGITISRSGGKRYLRPTEKHWKTIQGAYGIDLELSESEDETTGTG